MRNQFGELLRTRRESKGVSMGQVARHLGVSVPYLSDVERGNRAPLAPAKIVAVAAFLDVDLMPLLVAAANYRGAFELEARDVSPRQQALGAMMMRRWSELTEEDLGELERVFEREKRK